MLADAVTDRVPFRWVGGFDSIYGNSPTFVQGVRQPRQVVCTGYFVRCSCLDKKSPQELIPPEQRRPKPSRGRPYTQPLVIGTSQQVVDVIAALPSDAWRRITVAEGSQGPRVYDYAEMWVWIQRKRDYPVPVERLLVRTIAGPGARAKVSPFECASGRAVEKGI